MKLEVEFKESKHHFPVSFGEIQTAGDGGFERGYEEGEKAGYTNGYEIGAKEGAEVGYNRGKQEEYDRFWDNLQDYGNRTDCYFMFYFWTPEMFPPKYDIRPVKDGRNMFTHFGACDLVQVLGERVLDTSLCKKLDGMFNYAKAERIPPISFLSATSFSTPFYWCDVKTIDKVILKEDGSQNISTCFTWTKNLVDIDFDGVIGFGINFQWTSALSTTAMKNTILHLKNHAGTENEFAYTVKFSIDCWTKLDAEGATAPGGVAWKDYVNQLGYLT